MNDEIKNDEQSDDLAADNKTEVPEQKAPSAPEDKVSEERRIEEEMLRQMEQSSSELPSAKPIEVSPVDLPPIEEEGAMQADPTSQDFNLKMILDIPVDVHVEVGQTRIPIRDVLRLGVGSVVELDRQAGQPADIVVNGKMIGQGDVVVVNETFGIRITKLVGVQERIQSL